MFSWFKRKKEKWCLVKTLDIAATSDRVNGIIYFHLYESDLGNRKIELATTFSTFMVSKESLVEVAKRSKLYQTKIYRWENGRIDPEIPTYNQIPEEDTVNVLKGKVNV